MARWLREFQRIENEVDRILRTDLATLNTPALILLARNDARQILDRIERHRDSLRGGPVSRFVSSVNNSLTVVSGGVWTASLLGATAILPVIVLAAKISTPIGALYVVGDFAKKRARKRRIKKLNEWYGKVEGHLKKLEIVVTSYLLRPPNVP